MNQPIKDFQDNYKTATLLIAATLSVFTFLILFNVIGRDTPFVVADEWLYNESTRLVPLAEARFPSYLFFIIYKITLLFDSNFLPVVRILNALLYVSALPFIYAITRQVASRGKALYVAIVALLLPMDTYVAYFMPESFYFLFFWILSWLLICVTNLQYFTKSALIGFLIGLGTLIKFHALFILPAVIVFLFFEKILRNEVSFRKLAGGIIILSGVTFLIRYALGYLCAGNAGLSLRGAFYAGTASSLELLYKSIGNILLSFGGHLSAILLLFGGVFIFILFQRKHVDLKTKPQYSKILLWAILTLVILMCVSAVFTALVAGQGIHERANRIHLRYYNFIFPIFIILLAGLAVKEQSLDVKQRLLKIIPAALIALLPYVGYRIILKYFALGVVDCPELFAMAIHPFVAYLSIILSIVIALTYIISTRFSLRLKLFGYTSIMAFASMLSLFIYFKETWRQNSYTIAGQFCKNYLGIQINKLYIIGPDTGETYATLFCIDSNQPRVIGAHSVKPFDSFAKAHEDAWLLIFNNLVDVPKGYYRIKLRDSELVRLGSRISLDFSSKSNIDAFVSLTGISVPEPWGRWSDSDVIRIRFSSPLPPKFKITMTAGGFGPNIGQDFILSLNGQTKKFQLTADAQLIGPFIFENFGQVSEIQITVPAPTSPHSLGQGEDMRKLGIALVDMKIEPIAD